MQAERQGNETISRSTIQKIPETRDDEAADERNKKKPKAMLNESLQSERPNAIERGAARPQSLGVSETN